jgi:pimeloyl-ACP methyl ester carboxylesterase
MFSSCSWRVCVTAVVGMSDPVQYARLAKPFQGERDVWALRQPGFRRGEALPESLELLLEMHAGGLRAELGETPFVLAGLSSGGVVAHALAQHLCARGTPPAGVVVVDSYAPADRERFARLAPGLGDELMLRLQDPSYATPGDNGWITAMLHYEKFSCPLEDLPVPVIFLRAETPWRAGPRTGSRPGRSAAPLSSLPATTSPCWRSMPRTPRHSYVTGCGLP